MAARRSPQSILAEVGAALASSLTQEGILSAARQICEAMGVFSCDIWEFEPGARHVTLMATWCVAEDNPYGDTVGDTAELDDWESMRTVVEGRVSSLNDQVPVAGGEVHASGRQPGAVR